MLAVVTLAAFIGPALAQHGGRGPASPYAGEQRRAVKSLSEHDIAELRRGGGWGLAKAAELNGVPGPAHLMELKDDLALNDGQVAAIDEIFATMKADAIAEGERLIAHEQALEDAFRTRSVTHDSLRHLLANIEQSRAALRYIHLAAHLNASALLRRSKSRATSRCAAMATRAPTCRKGTTRPCGAGTMGATEGRRKGREPPMR